MNYNCDPLLLGFYLKELERFSDKYEYNIQVWNSGNAIYLSKDDVELINYGGHISLVNCMRKILEYIYRINQTPEQETIFFKLENDI